MGILKWCQFPGQFLVEGQPWESESTRLVKFELYYVVCGEVFNVQNLHDSQKKLV